ncbi:MULTISPECIES: NUDIX hydrolase [Paraliobacillus]|uniref:NUDIX hydrolase n=1 Tax=Paraliobacillus TaxID=200903 RepID=UPI000DD36071|nr:MULTISPECIES: NUDIX hydrolase [Paraliobacillus]
MDATFFLKNAVFNYRVAGVMIEDDHVLIHKQVKEKHWALPGGRVKVLEDSQTSIKREIKEELGFDVSVDNLLWITENFFAYNNQNYHEIGLYYRISSAAFSSSFTKEEFYGEEGERLIYKWTPISEIDGINLYPEFLKDGLKEIPSTPKHLILKHYKM